MPTPQEDESRDEFIDRCIPIVLEDGTASDPAQTMAVCSSMWDDDKEPDFETLNMIRKTYTVDCKAVDADAGIFEAMISTEERDRDGDILMASGAQLESFLKNPVVLFAHSYHDAADVVGKALEVEPIPGLGVRARWQFVDRGVSENADMVRGLWAGGFLNATSIGFIPHESTEIKNEDNGRTTGKLITDWELLEFSIVVVPSNQSALRLAVKTLEMPQYDDVALKHDRIYDATDASGIVVRTDELTTNDMLNYRDALLDPVKKTSHWENGITSITYTNADGTTSTWRPGIANGTIKHNPDAVHIDTDDIIVRAGAPSDNSTELTPDPPDEAPDPVPATELTEQPDAQDTQPSNDEPSAASPDEDIQQDELPDDVIAGLQIIVDYLATQMR